MNEKIVFVRTSSGEDEVRSRTAHLSKDIKRALVMVDGTSSVAEIMKRSSPSLRGMLEDMFTELARGGYIQDKAKPARPTSTPTPAKPQTSAPSTTIKNPAEEVDELDFTAAFRVPTKAMLDAEGARQAEQARDAERQARLKAEQEAIVARERAEGERRAKELADAKAEHAKAEAMVRAAAQEKANLEAEVAKLKAQAEAEARARAEAEKLARQVAAKAQAKLVAEAARLKADQEAAVRAAAERRAQEVLEAARVAEQRAAEVKAEAEARARAVAEEKATLEAEMARLKAHAEEQARARSEAEKQAKLAADAARMQAEQLAREAAARLKAEQEAAARAEAERHAQEVLEASRLAEQHAAEVKAEAEARARAVAEEKARLEAEVAKLKELADAEAGARLEANEQAKREAEAARIKAEQEAARAREAMEMEKARAAAEAAAREEAERIARQAEAARVQAEREAESVRAEAARLKAEQEAEKARAEAERIRAEQEAEKARADAERVKVAQEAERARAEAERIKAEQEAEKARTEAERIKAEQMAERARAEAERIKAEQEAESARAEAARLKAEQEAERARAEAERIRIEQEAESARAEAERIRVEREAEKARAVAASVAMQPEAAAVRDPSQWVTRSDSAGAPFVDRRKTSPAVAGCDPRGGNNGVPIVERRTTTAAVVFFDIVGYTKQPDRRQIELKQQFSQLLSDSLDPLEAGERIILDTGDGAAIGFLQHPTDALQTAMHFREGLLSNKYHDALRVRIGIHLGPVSLVKDMNGQTNMLGDGINSAQRVMSFAGLDQIYVSRSYFEFISNLSDEYDALFRYLGGKQDKHGREHKVYELLSHPDEAAQAEAVEAAPAEGPISFNFDAFDAALLQTEAQAKTEALVEDVAGQLLKDSVGLAAEAAPEPEPVVPQAVQAESVAPGTDQAAEVGETTAPQKIPEFSEEEARQLADAQAKKWAEAEQRAAELARRQAETIPQQIFQQAVPEAPAPAPAEKPVAPVRRKPLPLGKILAGLFVLLLAALFIVPMLLPMQGYRTGIEQQLGAKLQQPVHIGKLSGRLLPTPALVLTDVSVGDAKQIKAQQAKLNFGFSALFGAVKPIDSLSLDGVTVDGAVLPAAALWLQQVASDRRYPLTRIELAHGKLESDGVGYSDVDGEFDFAANGQFAQAKLSANAHKLALEIHATPEQKLQLSVTLRDTALPSLPNWVFDDLKATGELSQDELRISDLDGRIRGGVLTGEARINWRAGWRVQGSLAAKVIPLENISKLLNGDMDGTAHFQMQSESLAKLADAAILNGVFSVKKGFISGVDVVETARLRSREGVPGGRTHFDALNGELYYANDSYQFRQLNINDSVMKAVGALTVSHQKLAGNFSADLSMRAGMGSVPLQVDGTIESPSLHVR